MMLRYARMLFAFPLLAAAFAGCNGLSVGKKETPFVPSPVPADFAIIVDENHDTYYNREHIQQVVSAQDLMSITTYTRYRDVNNTVSGSFKQEQPLTGEQIQAMWNEVSRNNLLAGSRMWFNWLSDADLYRVNQHTVQIRANGQVRAYNSKNGFPPRTRDLMLLVDAVRLPIGQKGAPVVGRPGVRASEIRSPSDLTQEGHRLIDGALSNRPESQPAGVVPGSAPESVAPGVPAIDTALTQPGTGATTVPASGPSLD